MACKFPEYLTVGSHMLMPASSLGPLHNGAHHPESPSHRNIHRQYSRPAAQLLASEFPSSLFHKFPLPSSSLHLISWNHMVLFFALLYHFCTTRPPIASWKKRKWNFSVRSSGHTLNEMSLVSGVNHLVEICFIFIIS